MTELAWREYYAARGKFGYGYFVFFGPGFSWQETDTVLITTESVYDDDDDDSDCDTPMSLFDKGYRFAFETTDVLSAYDEVWLAEGGVDSIIEFGNSIRYYLQNDAYLLPID